MPTTPTDFDTLVSWLKSAGFAGADPSGKVTMRSIIVREHEDAGEIIREREMDERQPPDGNGENWGPGATTIYVDSAAPLAREGLASYESTWHSKHPEPSRSVGYGADQVGVPSAGTSESGGNHGGRLWWVIQRMNLVGDWWRMNFQVPHGTNQGPAYLEMGRQYTNPRAGTGENPERAFLVGGDARSLPANEWFPIGHQRGLLVVTNKTDGRFAIYSLDHHDGDKIQPIKAPADAFYHGDCTPNGDGWSGMGRIVINYNPEAGQHGYRILNRHSTTKVVSFTLVGGLTPPTW